MPRRVGGALIVAAVIAFVSAGRTSADEGDTQVSSETDDSGGPSPGAIGATASEEKSGGQAVSGSAPSKPKCSWVPYDMTESQVPGAGTGGVTRDVATKTIGASPGPGTETLYRKICPGAPAVLVWVPDAADVDVDALIASAFQSVRAQLPAPALDINPPAGVGGTVNLGMWLAVADPGQVSVTASVGPVWATVTARFERTEWSMGNGDVVACDGVGTPIVDVDTVEQGPCGYTYRWPSAPEFTGAGLAYSVSVTGHWVVSFATSTGESGTLESLSGSTGFAYEVREVQTVRVSGDG